MTTFIIVLLVIISIIIFLISKKKTSTIDKETPPYIKKKTLLNEKEQILFHRLGEAMPDKYVMAQVRLADIISVKKCKNWQTWFNKIQSKSIDFVICNKAFEIIACIEMDGKTHEQKNRQKADNNKDEALQAANIPIIRIQANKLTSTDEIKTILEKALIQ